MKKFLKTFEASRYLGVSRSSLTNWVKQGLLGSGLTPGGHYRFTVTELDSFAEKRGLKIPRKITGGESARILIIDDDIQFRDFVREAMEAFSDYELKEAKDGMEGALLVGTWKPDLVIVDLRMPNMNGIEFCRLLKQKEETSEISIIIASAYLSPEAKSEIQEIGVDVVLDKPVRLASLAMALTKCVDLQISSK
jgi:excisionase family DNA binding protein